MSRYVYAPKKSLSYVKATITWTRFQIDTVSWPGNRIENGTVSNCLHGTFLSIFFFYVFWSHSDVRLTVYLRSIYTSRVRQFRARIRDRFQIDAVSPFSTIYTTNETISFKNASLLRTFSNRHGFNVGLNRCRTNQGVTAPKSGAVTIDPPPCKRTSRRMGKSGKGLWEIDR